ncbi:NAD(P)/FAD-dependent oxidoreductase [Patescibacteria group bacterium]|nr:NAD(P)/FAD-dependent oxidoreductase [Patescibacteria group bacterium]MBU1721821.1 NAD(P)/FAD-dependent oxidoreductase [Patescibacteria group bacterium]MBU1901684.1 NAD(P)/FAD-dependent oxidoreductase [Patescibacteria group bacterium]
MKKHYNIIIVGGSFAGITLVKHLSEKYSVLILDAKPCFGSSVESTGLITSHTRKIFQEFFDVDNYITNQISSICVVAPDYDKHFFSYTKEPWIYQTDTKALVKAFGRSLPESIDVLFKAVYKDLHLNNDGTVDTISVMVNGEKKQISCDFLVGADGNKSTVAKTHLHLSETKDFLFGYEEVFEGEVLLGKNAAETIYHFWFGEFSLGYGGWLSPTKHNGKPAFRVGLAKLDKDKKTARELTEKFVEILQEKKIIKINNSKPIEVFGNTIPIEGVLKNISYKNALLLGDSAGFCGAFAADGIKGAIIAGKEAAPIIEEYLAGEKSVIIGDIVKKKLNNYNSLLSYYKRQLRYRWIWNQMKKDRTFHAMYDIIASEKDTFLDQFCDSKDRRKSLTRTVLKVKYFFKLTKYSLFILWDMLFVKNK